MPARYPHLVKMMEPEFDVSLEVLFSHTYPMSRTLILSLGSLLCRTQAIKRGRHDFYPPKGILNNLYMASRIGLATS
jgi:hypothetical protein